MISSFNLNQGLIRREYQVIMWEKRFIISLYMKKSEYYGMNSIQKI